MGADHTLRDCGASWTILRPASLIARDWLAGLTGLFIESKEIISKASGSSDAIGVWITAEWSGFIDWRREAESVLRVDRLLIKWCCLFF